MISIYNGYQMNILNCKNREEFRLWLTEHASTENECFLNVKKGKPVSADIFYYIDAVEEAICFGWIDSSQLVHNGIRYQRFSPRKKNSVWTELNKERARRLEKLGLMTPLGKKSLPKMSYRIDPELIEALKTHRCYKTFKSFPILYQRVRAYNVTFYKKIDKSMYEKSLKHLIEETKKGKMFGEWNDYGRLLNY